MNAKLLIIPLLIAAAAEAKERSVDTFLTFQPPPEKVSFGLRQAKELADAKRMRGFGACGMVKFREKVGNLWIFETFIGYAGQSGPDIAVYEPKPQLPSFRGGLEVPKQLTQPTLAEGSSWMSLNDLGKIMVLETSVEFYEGQKAKRFR